MRKIKFSIDTLGCKVNQSESDFIAEELQKKGMEPVSRSRNPDWCLVNTCTVTSQSDRKARQLIRRIKAENKDSRILVMGCFVVFNRSFLKECGIDFMVKNKDKYRIPDLIEERAAEAGIPDLIADEAAGGVPQCGKYGGTHSRPLVKVQDGCEQNCAYCIVPVVRGGYKSVPLKDILKRITELQSCGFEEVVLTGIHIGKYGVDFDAGSLNLANTDTVSSKVSSPYPNIIASDLAELLDRIIKETDIKRIRISSIEINEIGNRLLDVLKRNKKRIAPHLHIPLQSGSDRVLKLMGRPYNSGYYLKKIDRVRELFPGIALTTDIMVGFPGEGDDDFTRTADVIKKVAFSKIHVFKYSRREHTAACMMAGQVDEKVKSRRSVILRNLGDELRISYLKSNTGKVLDVVCEEANRCKSIAGTKSRDNVITDLKSKCNSILVSGTSGNYIRVYFKMDTERFDRLKGKIVQVTTDSICKNGLSGKLC
jgi:threonylcarbamoyladenosine tRNA methylthiotransferase MtaB